MSEDEVDSQGHYWRIAKWFPDMDNDTLSCLRAFHSELIFFNGRMNLISPRTEKNADLVHLADAIIGGRSVLNANSKEVIFDIGSGNGVPGVIMAILAPTRKFVLVDADARKIEFLKHCASRAGAKNCSFLHARLEDLEQGVIECAITRGFASLSKSLLMARRAASEGCEFYHFKSTSWSTEVAEIPAQILAAWDPIHVSDYKLPESETTLSIVLTRRHSL